jgi:hypothetical protein
MKTLYVNGDSHSAQVYGHEHAGTSFVEQLAKRFSAKLINQALPGGSNQRIIRTATEDLRSLDPNDTFVLIGWSSFERAEWYYNQQWHKIAGSSAYTLPEDLVDTGQRHLNNFHTDMTHCLNCHLEQHQAIWNFHNNLISQGYQFMFFQGCETFFFDGLPEQDKNFTLPWKINTWAHDPYVTVLPDNTRHIESFSHLCLAQGFNHSDQYAHFGQDAHDYWADFLTPKIQNLIN